MTIKSKISHLSALGLAMALGLTACGGESEADNSITLQYAFFAPAGTYPGVQMQKWSEELTERTDGAVTVETFPGGTLLKSGDIFSGVSSGIVDVGLDQPSLDVGQFPLSSAVMLPLDFENSQQASAAYLDLRNLKTMSSSPLLPVNQHTSSPEPRSRVWTTSLGRRSAEAGHTCRSLRIWALVR